MLANILRHILGDLRLVTDLADSRGDAQNLGNHYHLGSNFRSLHPKRETPQFPKL
jgi:hypothetical protein